MFQDTGQKAIPRQPICLNDAKYDYILEEIGRRDKIEFERKVMFIMTIWRINTSVLNGTILHPQLEVNAITYFLTEEEH